MLNLGARLGLVVIASFRPFYPRGKDLYTVYRRLGLPPWPFWTCVCVWRKDNILPHTGIVFGIVQLVTSRNID